jgi:hypothetical protein
MIRRLLGLTTAACFLSLGLAAPAAADPPFPTPPQVFRGHFYSVMDDWVSWPDAVASCDQSGGHLVTINSEEENQFVYNLEPDTWLGASDAAQEGVWAWVTGEPFSYTNWAPSEPNNLDTETYLAYFTGPPPGPEWLPGQWNDVPELQLPFVCEYEPPFNNVAH